MNELNDNTQDIIDLQIEIIQVSNYIEIIQRILAKHRSMSIIKVVVFSFIIKKRSNLHGNIFNANNTVDLVLKFLSQAKGLFEEMSYQIPYIIEAIDILIKEGFCTEHLSELLCTSKQGKKKFDSFTESVIQESKSYSDRQFLREVISIV